MDGVKRRDWRRALRAKVWRSDGRWSWAIYRGSRQLAVSSTPHRRRDRCWSELVLTCNVSRPATGGRRYRIIWVRYEGVGPVYRKIIESVSAWP